MNRRLAELDRGVTNIADNVFGGYSDVPTRSGSSFAEQIMNNLAYRLNIYLETDTLDTDKIQNLCNEAKRSLQHHHQVNRAEHALTPGHAGTHTGSGSGVYVMYNDERQEDLLKGPVTKLLRRSRYEYLPYNNQPGATLLYVMYVTTPRVDQICQIHRLGSALEKCDKVIVLVCRQGKSTTPLMLRADSFKLMEIHDQFKHKLDVCELVFMNGEVDFHMERNKKTMEKLRTLSAD